MIMSGELLGKLLAISQTKGEKVREEFRADLADEEKKLLRKIEVCQESFADPRKRKKVIESVSQTLYTTNLPLPEAMMSFFVALMMEPEKESAESDHCNQLFALLNSHFEFFELYATVLRNYYRVTEKSEI